MQHQGFLEKKNREKKDNDIKCNAKKCIFIWSKVNYFKSTQYEELFD